MKPNNLSSVRIIGGQWRSRRVNFNPTTTLRPTPDRVRETLFNWLAPVLPGAICVDLFSGTGVLAFEALSRGAQRALLVDKDTQVCQMLHKTAEQLNTKQLDIINQDVVVWLKQPPTLVADIIFVDPPYGLDLLPECFFQLEENGHIKAASWIYFEHNQPVLNEQIPCQWEVVHEKKAASVYYYLAKK